MTCRLARRFCDDDRGLVTTGRARGAQKLNIEVWLSLVERYVRDVEVASSNLVTSTISSVHNRFQLWTLDIFMSAFIFRCLE